MPLAPGDTATVVTDLATRVTDIEYVYRNYSTPTLVEGVPDPDTWTYTETRAPWGRYLVEMNGYDVTFLRNQLTIVTSMSWAEPYGDEACEIYFPQVTIWDSRGTGALSGLVDYAETKIWRVLPDGTLDSEPEWEGFVASWERSGNKVTAQCLGVLHQLDLYVRAPGISDLPDDIGTLIPFNFNPSTRPALRMAQMDYVNTGIPSRDRGAWDQGVLNYIGRLLGRSVTATGDQWTVLKTYPAKGVLTMKDRTTTHWTTQVGIHGVKEQLSRELTMRVNVWYAEGEDEVGTRWRNSFPSNDGTGVFFQPIPGAYNEAVHPIDEGPNGTLVAHPERLDPASFRLEGYANLGQSVSKEEASRLLQGEYFRQFDPGWLGNITLTTDLAQGSRRKIRAGQNIVLQGYEGGNITLHIARHELSDPFGNASSNLTVDSKARDIDSIQAYMDRKAAEARNPVKRLLLGRSSSETVDSIQPWDTTRGDGWIPRQRAPVLNNGSVGSQVVAVPKHVWTVQRITCGEEETIIKSEFYTSPPTRLHVSICDAPPAGANTSLEYWTGPLTAPWPADPYVSGAWDIYEAPAEQLIAWGQFGQAGGYSPGTQTNPYLGITGAIIDESEWNLTHSKVPAETKSPTFVWVVIWAVDSATSFWGRLSRQRKVR